MKTVRYFWTRFLPSYPRVLIYMLQATEYKIGRYIDWYGRTSDFRRVAKRQQLVPTKKARLLVFTLRCVSFAVAVLVALSVYAFFETEWALWWVVAIGLLVVAPYLLAYGIILPLAIGRVLVQLPREKQLIQKAKNALMMHPATRVAILGSFGKTTAKEMLLTVLSEGLAVAATPGNMNTAIGISRFALKLKGDEDVLLFELGEEKVGDIQQLSRIVHPEWAIITGINEAHLESFKTLERTEQTIFEITDFVDEAHMYQNDESMVVTARVGTPYSRKGVGRWKVQAAKTSIEGTDFTMVDGKSELAIHTALLGLHTVGVTAAVAAIASELGLTKNQIETGFRKVVAFEHRMQAKPMHGAWIIDDTYNGNSDGVKAGLELLASLDAKRRIYVTPGLVEQGTKTAQVHQVIGEQAAIADIVVLMNNSVAGYMIEGLQKANFKGQLLVIDDPLDFYTNLDQFVAAGDVVLMQNDWTDNYA